MLWIDLIQTLSWLLTLFLNWTWMKLKFHIGKRSSFVMKYHDTFRLYHSRHLYKRFSKENWTKCNEIFFFNMRKLSSFKKTLNYFVVCGKKSNFVLFSVWVFRKQYRNVCWLLSFSRKSWRNKNWNVKLNLEKCK